MFFNQDDVLHYISFGTPICKVDSVEHGLGTSLKFERSFSFMKYYSPLLGTIVHKTSMKFPDYLTTHHCQLTQLINANCLLFGLRPSHFGRPMWMFLKVLIWTWTRKSAYAVHQDSNYGIGPRKRPSRGHIKLINLIYVRRHSSNLWLSGDWRWTMKNN